LFRTTSKQGYRLVGRATSARFWVVAALALLAGSVGARGIALASVLSRATAGELRPEPLRTAGAEQLESTETLRRKAERGDPEAEYKLGLAYDVGIGAPQDLAQAAAWYSSAAEQGYAAAQFSLGLMYANGRGVPQDLVRAHVWLNLAAGAQQPGARSERDLIAKKMTRQQIAEAIRQARAWEPKSPSPPR
jgi:TPR repeat protein